MPDFPSRASLADRIVKDVFIGIVVFTLTYNVYGKQLFDFNIPVTVASIVLFAAISFLTYSSPRRQDVLKKFDNRLPVRIAIGIVGGVVLVLILSWFTGEVLPTILALWVAHIIILAVIYARVVSMRQ